MGHVPPLRCGRRASDVAAGGVASFVNPGGSCQRHTQLPQLGDSQAPRFSVKPTAFPHFKCYFLSFVPASECTGDKTDTVLDLMNLQCKENLSPSP